MKVERDSVLDVYKEAITAIVIILTLAIVAMSIMFWGFYWYSQLLIPAIEHGLPAAGESAG